jgi:ankyrin repeat protein
MKHLLFFVLVAGIISIQASSYDPVDTNMTDEMILAAIKNNNFNAVRSIRPSYVDSFRYKGDTLLTFAIRLGDEAMVALLLLEKGANPNLENDYGLLPLEEAGKHEDMLMLLVAAGAEQVYEGKKNR